MVKLSLEADTVPHNSIGAVPPPSNVLTSAQGQAPSRGWRLCNLLRRRFIERTICSSEWMGNIEALSCQNIEGLELFEHAKVGAVAGDLPPIPHRA